MNKVSIVAVGGVGSVLVGDTLARMHRHEVTSPYCEFIQVLAWSFDPRDRAALYRDAHAPECCRRVESMEVGEADLARSLAWWPDPLLAICTLGGRTGTFATFADALEAALPAGRRILLLAIVNIDQADLEARKRTQADAAMKSHRLERETQIHAEIERLQKLAAVEPAGKPNGLRVLVADRAAFAAGGVSEQLGLKPEAAKTFFMECLRHVLFLCLCDKDHADPAGKSLLAAIHGVLRPGLLYRLGHLQVDTSSFRSRWQHTHLNVREAPGEPAPVLDWTGDGQLNVTAWNWLDAEPATGGAEAALIFSDRDERQLSVSVPAASRILRRDSYLLDRLDVLVFQSR